MVLSRHSAVCILNEVCGMYRGDRLDRNFCSNYYGCGEIKFWLNYIFGTDLNLLDKSIPKSNKLL